MDDMVSTSIMNEGYQPWNKKNKKAKYTRKIRQVKNEIKVNQSKTKINCKNQSKPKINCTVSKCDLLWSLWVAYTTLVNCTM